VVDTGLLQSAVYDVIQANLLHLDLSKLFSDLKRINEGLDDCLRECLKAFSEHDQQAA
jgi:hypothetical protein